MAKLTFPSWRSETFKTLVEKFVQYLPDMDIAMNKLDQPRLVVPWDEMQALLAKEYEARSLPPDAIDSFTSGQAFLADLADALSLDFRHLLRRRVRRGHHRKAVRDARLLCFHHRAPDHRDHLRHLPNLQEEYRGGRALRP